MPVGSAVDPRSACVHHRRRQWGCARFAHPRRHVRHRCVRLQPVRLRCHTELEAWCTRWIWCAAKAAVTVQRPCAQTTLISPRTAIDNAGGLSVPQWYVGHVHRFKLPHELSACHGERSPASGHAHAHNTWSRLFRTVPAESTLRSLTQSWKAACVQPPPTYASCGRAAPLDRVRETQTSAWLG